MKPEERYVQPQERTPLFHVIGHVATIYADPESPLTPHEAAYVAVARMDAPGDYEWTHHGNKVRLSVSYEQVKDEDAQP